MEVTVGAPLSSVCAPLRAGCCWSEWKVSVTERAVMSELTLKCVEVSKQISQVLGRLWRVACLLELPYSLWGVLVSGCTSEETTHSDDEL